MRRAFGAGRARDGSRRFPAGGLAVFVLLGMLIADAVLAPMAQAQAPRVSVRGMEMRGHGRIVLEFDTPPKVAVRATDSILVISFDQPISIASEKLTGELPSYVSVVRRDPDGRAIRLALSRTIRPNLMEAGERVFIDLLPESWTGLPPGLPQDVVDDLARRAREAEAKVRDVLRRRMQEERRPLAWRVGNLPTLTRLVFEPPANVPVTYKQEGDKAELFFDAALSAEPSRLKSVLPPAVLDVAVDNANAALRLTFTLEPGSDLRGFREDETFVLDFGRPPIDRMSPEIAVSAPPATNAPIRPASPASSLAAPGNPPAPSPAPASAAGSVPVPVASAPPAAAPAQTSVPRPVQPHAPRQAGPIRPIVSALGDGLKIAFPFAGRTAAAAFQRHDEVTLIFDTADLIEPLRAGQIPPTILTGGDVSRISANAVMLRFQLARDALVRLSPEGQGWALTVGDEALTPTDPILVNRTVDSDGRTVVTLPIPDISTVHWIDNPATGERVAVATAHAPSRGVPKLQRFVEFRVLPSAHGVAVQIDADDVVVRPGVDNVTVSRDGGLTLSLARAGTGDTSVQAAPLALSFEREAWGKLRSGANRERMRELQDAAADASRARKTPARLALARFLIANGFSAEGRGVLQTIEIEDQDFVKDRDYHLWRGLADIQSHRHGDAARWLNHPSLADDPEAILWRAVLDARARRWPAALAGFKRSPDVIEAYSDDLQGRLRIHTTRAAIEMRDFAEAERELERLGQLPLDVIDKDEAQLLRARIDEAVGRPEAAIASYRQIMSTGRRPAAAEAMLSGTRLAMRERAATVNDALAQYETLSVVWRGDEIEIRTLDELGRLYAQAGRWREAFQVSRRANEIFPNHEVSRGLHDETARLFEDLFLTGKSETLSRFDALALYYDFKEYTPPGRRGDEMIRRLTDRMVELDLIDQASDLLQYQVDNRLDGAARATVSARLALLRLMAGKAAQALQTLQASRLPELPAEVKRARMLLEARALSDLSRTDLAVEMLDGETGPEIERLRADIYWQGRRWREAGEAFERILGERWRGRDPLSDKDRLDVLRAAISYGLSDETLSLDRLRGKFAAKMADSEDASTFAFLTAPGSSRTRQFRDVTRTVANADTLMEFLEEYRKRYPDTSTAARRRRAPAGEGGGNGGAPGSTPAQGAAQGAALGAGGGRS